MSSGESGPSDPPKPSGSPDSSGRPSAGATVAKLAGCCALAGVLLAALLFPVVGGAGLMSNRASEVIANGSARLITGDVPAVTTMLDAHGQPIAWLYTQRRFEVPSDKIADTMKLAIVSIEDKRFAEHNGVDWKGTLTGLAGYASGDEETRGGSTIEQQYVKNYQLLVTARNDAERRAATATTPTRKMREIRMALTLDRTFSKSEILTRYLNLVSFGNNAFGVQSAAQTYFGVDASELRWHQAALLAGLVRSTSSLNPYLNPDRALERRNLVLDTLIDFVPQEAAVLRAAKTEPLGILPQPRQLPRGCIAAADRAFFCEYVQEYLSRAGISREQVARAGYLIRTTLDPDIQTPVQNAVTSFANPRADGVASVMSVVKPGKDAHPVVAMAGNRTYGLDREAGETVQPQPFSLVGDGAGSVFKIFTVAAALEAGMGINMLIDVPWRFDARGFGSGGAKGCPEATWCVQNVAPYGSPMNVTDALATSPNTAFAKLITQIGVERTVDMAVKLGLRSYAEPGSARDYDPGSNESLADFIKRQNIGSFTLGPFEVNALELSNVAATLASEGVWCPPSPIEAVFDRHGNPVELSEAPCEPVVPGALADTMAHAMSKDSVGIGTGAIAAGASGWDLPMSGKTGTSESHRSASFVGFTNALAAASYIYDDSAEPSELCSYPLRRCGSGNLYGGNEPARTWFTALRPIATNFGFVGVPPPLPPYIDGGPNSEVPDVVGMSEADARRKLTEVGFHVAEKSDWVNDTARNGSVIGTFPAGKTIPGSLVTLLVSNGIVPAPPPPAINRGGSDDWGPGSDSRSGPNTRSGPAPAPVTAGSTVVEIPGLPPITIPLLAPP